MRSANRLTSGLEAFFSAVLPRSTSAIPSWIASARNWVSGPASGCASSARTPVPARAKRARVTAVVLMTSSPRVALAAPGWGHGVPSGLAAGGRPPRAPPSHNAPWKAGFPWPIRSRPLWCGLRALRGGRHADVLAAAVLERQGAGEGLSLFQGLRRFQQHQVIAARRKDDGLISCRGLRSSAAVREIEACLVLTLGETE